MTADDQIQALQDELNAKDAEIARLKCGSRFYQVGAVSKSDPAFMPAHLPFPSEGVTVATLDKAGNLTIKVDQPSEAPKPIRSDWDAMLRAIGTGRKIEAIKLYRAMFDASLKDSKDAIEWAMPIRPIREAPEDIAAQICADRMRFGSDEMIRAQIIKAIYAERSGT